jgi:hypothetical protein
MEEKMSTYRKKILAAAVIAALGVSASAEADTVTASWTGALTFLGTQGSFTLISDNCFFGGNYPCERGPINGTLTFDTVTGAGNVSVAPFSFAGSGNAVFTSMSLQKIGDGVGGPGSLVLGNMLFNWNGNNGIPASIVWDASGLLSAVNGGLSVGQTITGGALPASDNTDTIAGAGGTTHPIGPALLATTIWDTTLIGQPCAQIPFPDFGNTCFGRNPSGTLPLVSDTVADSTNGDLGVGGSPMPAPPFPGFNLNIDILSAQVTNIEAVPVPAAVWLFGSGLAGLIGVARRKRWNTDK